MRDCERRLKRRESKIWKNLCYTLIYFFSLPHILYVPMQLLPSESPSAWRALLWLCKARCLPLTIQLLASGVSLIWGRGGDELHSEEFSAPSTTHCLLRLEALSVFSASISSGCLHRIARRTSNTSVTELFARGR